MIQVGIAGSAGYTAGELIRLLLQHPKAVINFAYSTSNAGNLISSVHDDLIGETDLTFTNEVNPNVNVVFLCLGHGNSKKFLEEHTFAPHTKVIDLSNDFRLEKDALFMGRDFVYGLPEFQKAAIKEASNIANPGCFATAIQLALLPLAKEKKLTHEVHIHAVTGSTGAGQSLSATSHFTWRNNNFSYYKPFTHQHLGEISETLTSLQGTLDTAINFMPYRGDFTRGIFVTAYTNFDGSLEDAKAIYKNYFKNAPFTTVSDTELNLKQVVNTNKCLVHLHKHENKLLITSCIDNLLKGASGQAIHNMNLMFGLEETTGLHIKASYF
ncbi:N-acetyl-gamma-glutamyl-phosphate reductase [Neptunitalea lumnitzerae]|uniref:N-acetyl-gamma-glutamyl-phosphate reductase n=1 Tax=Neptunitalea lumnitzerae TaxID=2965509 RepID=A0ABQ5MK56_9FLAO|nr:N-acetyl-gamma-glutamyl-phosphate reductase [Neptunitalea sp. Y10]GLB49798.1 N-acetyl-gamma-glutamyl-phosphate reductase [Neptunitalea sp. Y10]